MKRRIKENIKFIIAFIALIIFLWLIREVFQDGIMRIDTIVYNKISKYLIKEQVTQIMKLITSLGSVIVVGGVAILSCIIPKNKKISIAILINLTCITISNVVLKQIIHRKRPEGFRLVDENGYSFPSGHSMVSTAFYGFFIYLIYKYVKNRKLRNTLIIIISVMIFMICFSRIYLGVHYTSDVIAGISVSISYLVVYTHFVQRYIEKGVVLEDEDKAKKKDESKNQEINK